MSKSVTGLLSAAIITGALLTFTTAPIGFAFAQTPPANEAGDKSKTDTDATKQDAAAEKKAKADARKAKRAEARKAKAEKRATGSAGRRAARERQKQCGAEWKEARAAGKVEKGMTWPKYWSACNTRLKGKAA